MVLFPEQESCRTLGVEHRVVECSERVILYADVLVYRAFGIDDFVGRMYGDHSMAGASIIGTVYKGIAFDQYIFDRSRFVPAFGVGLNQYGAHARFVIRIVLYHHLSWSGDQSSSCTGSCEVAVTYFHFGGTGHVLYAIVIELQACRNVPVETYFHYSVRYSPYVPDRCRGKAFHGGCPDKGDGISLEVSVESIALSVHEA